jgi:hypothetical protein
MRIFDRHGDMSGERFKDLQLILGEGVGLLVIDRENADHLVSHLERNRDLGTYVRLARDIVRIHADVVGVAHPAGRGTVTDHAPSSDLLSLFVGRAAAHAMQNHVAAVGIPQPDRHLNAADRGRDIVDHAVEQHIEIQRRGDQRRGPLQLHQNLDEVAGGVNARGGGAQRIGRFGISRGIRHWKERNGHADPPEQGTGDTGVVVPLDVPPAGAMQSFEFRPSAAAGSPQFPQASRSNPSATTLWLRGC